MPKMRLLCIRATLVGGPLDGTTVAVGKPLPEILFPLKTSRLGFKNLTEGDCGRPGVKSHVYTLIDPSAASPGQAFYGYRYDNPAQES
jgi:hypothetical protein